MFFVGAPTIIRAPFSARSVVVQRGGDLSTVCSGIRPLMSPANSMNRAFEVKRLELP